MAGQCARLLCGYVYACAGHGESTTRTWSSPATTSLRKTARLLAEDDALWQTVHAETELDVASGWNAERARNTNV